MSLRYSTFNLVDTVTNNIVSLYNTKNCKHLLLTLNEGCFSKSTLSENDGISKLPTSIRDNLLQNQFIVEYDFAEQQELNKKCVIDRQKNYSGLYLAIMPTLSCNFACSYCYENLDQVLATQNMLTVTQNNLLAFVEAKLISDAKNELKVKWFGGEPLLAKEIILSLTERLKKIGSQYGCNYQATLVTNGYFLDTLTQKEFSELSLVAIQVTLDGPENIHNARRVEKTGKNSFCKIIANLKKIAHFFPNIIIRINIDKTNAAHVHELIEYLKECGILHLCSQIMFAYVDTQIGKFSFDANYCSVLQQKEVEEIYAIISANLQAHGLENYETLTYPRVLSVGCDAQIPNYYVIHPGGLVFKCLGDATILERAIYDLNTQQVLNAAREKQFLSMAQKLSKDCETCSLLPICQGGCAAKYFDLHDSGPFCWSFCHVTRQQIIKLAKRALSDKYPS